MSDRERLGQALLESVDTWVDDETSAEEQAKVDVVIAQSIVESEAARHGGRTKRARP